MHLPDLPISPALPAIAEALAHNHVVLGAPPGSGKTTLVPLALLDAPWLAGRKIVMLEPRRPAARMAAHRMATLLGEQVGDSVGYQVRFERRIGPQTRIEVLTEGLLLRRLQRDPELSDTGLVIFDEFHERSLTGDLSLALCLDVASALREDLRLMPMSASLDGQALAELLDATHLEAQGRSHPVQIHYLDRDPPVEDRLRRLAALIHQASDRHTGDVLAFLPGKHEIGRLHHLLSDQLDPNILIQPLHGEIPPAQQDAIIRGSGDRRRVILATDIAETCLTIEGITVVVDSGLNRKPRFDPATGLTRLETGFISQASALQRSGRAGRLGPGHCYRAWSEARQQRLERGIRPEILDADLAQTVLELAGWGIKDASRLNWLTAPPAAHLDQARELLRQLGAIDRAGQITANGRAMLRLPTHPRLAHLLVSARSVDDRQLAADMAALLGERDPVQQKETSDIRLRLDALRASRRGSGAAGANRGALRRIDQATRQLLRLCPGNDDASAGALSPGAALALAFPDRIAMARAPNSPHYLLRNGRAASLRPHDSLVGTPFLVVAALDAGSDQGRHLAGRAHPARGDRAAFRRTDHPSAGTGMGPTDGGRQGMAANTAGQPGAGPAQCARQAGRRPEQPSPATASSTGARAVQGDDTAAATAGQGRPAASPRQGSGMAGYRRSNSADRRSGMAHALAGRGQLAETAAGGRHHSRRGRVAGLGTTAAADRPVTGCLSHPGRYTTPHRIPTGR